VLSQRLSLDKILNFYDNVEQTVAGSGTLTVPCGGWRFVMSTKLPEIQVCFEHLNDVTVASFTVHEISSLANMERPMQQFKHEINTRHPEKLLIDFDGITYLATTGITMLLAILKWVRSYGGEVCLCGLSNAIREVFEAVQLTMIFTIFTDRDTALTRLSQR